MHEFNRGVTKYDIMPIPPVEAQSVRFPVGPIEIWVEYRLLDEAIAAAHTVTEGYEGDAPAIDDRGVSLHVFGELHPGATPVEFCDSTVLRKTRTITTYPTSRTRTKWCI